MRTGVPHGKQLLGVLSIALPSERPRHSKTKLEANVVVGLNSSVASLATSCSMCSVLAMVDVSIQAVCLHSPDSKYVAHLVVLEGHQRPASARGSWRAKTGNSSATER